MKLRFSVLPVGQGTGTLIEVLNANEESEETVLLDLGSLFWKVPQTGNLSADFVVERLRDRVEGPTFDGVFLSHGDADHINLIPRVLSKFKKPSEHLNREETLEVKSVHYAGAARDYVKRRVSVLRRIDEWRPGVPSVVNPFGAEQTTFPGTVLASAHGVDYCVLIANTVKANASVLGLTPTHIGSRGYLNNLCSLIMAIGYGAPQKQWLVASGDATGLTMARCNDRFEEGRIPGLPAVLSLTIPHHGSSSTAYDMLGLGGPLFDQAALGRLTINRFRQNLSPRTLSLSSGEVDRYRLPTATIVGEFAANLPAKVWYPDPAIGNEHFYTAHYTPGQLAVNPLAGAGAPANWPPAEGWFTLRTEKAVFTTDYFRGPNNQHVPSGFPPGNVLPDPGVAPYAPAPPFAAGWAWEIPENGLLPTVSRIEDRFEMSDEYLAFLEERHGPLPPRRFLFVPPAPAAAPPREEAPAPPARVRLG